MVKNKTLRMIPLLAALAFGACSDDSTGVDRSGQIRAVARDEQQAGIGGVVLRLVQADEAITRTTTVTGNAVFDDVGPGDYQLEVTVPQGYKLATTQSTPITFNMRTGQVKDISVSLSKVIVDKEPGTGGENPEKT